MLMSVIPFLFLLIPKLFGMTCTSWIHFFNSTSCFSYLLAAILHLSVTLAVLVVILMATLSPLPHRNTSSKPWLALSLYIQQPKTATMPNTHAVAPQDACALIFHHVLTEEVPQ